MIYLNLIKLLFLNFRTLECLSRHLYRVSLRGCDTGMTAKNVAIVWAPNLLRSKSLEMGGVAALQGVGVQAVVTEYLIRYCELIFSQKMPVYQSVADKGNSNSNSNSNNVSRSINTTQEEQDIVALVTASPSKNNKQQQQQQQTRPKSLAISTPTKLLSLEEARSRALQQSAALRVPPINAPPPDAPPQRYIDVGGGPATLPAKYHTVIEVPKQRGGRRRARSTSAGPAGWRKALFGKNKATKTKNNDLSQVCIIICVQYST